MYNIIEIQPTNSAGCVTRLVIPTCLSMWKLYYVTICKLCTCMNTFVLICTDPEGYFNAENFKACSACLWGFNKSDWSQLSKLGNSVRHHHPFLGWIFKYSFWKVASLWDAYAVQSCRCLENHISYFTKESLCISKDGQWMVWYRLRH